MDSHDGVNEHYKELLARHYSWMTGMPFPAKVAEQKAILAKLLSQSPACARRGMAVDLGSGPGFQSVALAELGFSPVIAIDLSEELLHELETLKGQHDIRCIRGDLMRFEDVVPRPEARVVTCMGDTITHLASRDEVTRLFAMVSEKLERGGDFVVSYRDLSSEARGLDRFIPVFSDANRIMTCFLEHRDQESVEVHDLVYARELNGWTFEKSSYRKLRLPVAWMEEAMTNAGFEVSCGQAGRLLCLRGRKT